MVLALDASSPAAVHSFTGTITTAAFSPPSDSFLLACVVDNSNAGVPADSSVSGGGLTWAVLAKKTLDSASYGGAGTEGGVYLWWAYAAAAPGSITVSDARSGGGGGWNHLLRVLVFTGAEQSPAGAIAAASSSSGLPSASLITTADNSWVWAESSDWAAAGLGTVGSGQTMDSEDDVGGQYSAHVWGQTATTVVAGTSVTCNLTAPTGQQFDMLVYEVREPQAGLIRAGGHVYSGALNQASGW